MFIDAEAERAAAEQRAQAIRVLADAEASKAAAVGLAEAQVMQAKAVAHQKEGEAEAQVIQVRAGAQADADEKLGLVAAKVTREKGLAEVALIEARADAVQKQGLAEAKVNEEKLTAEAKGIEAKADAMKKLDGVGKDHEEFKLRLDKEKSVELAQISIQKDIAAAQAGVIGEALKSARIDIVGGETMFFEQIINSISKGKALERAIDNSPTLATVRDTFFDGNGGSDFKDNLSRFVDQFGLKSDDIKNLSISALLLQLLQKADTDASRSTLSQMVSAASSLGIGDKPVRSMGLN